MPRVGHYGVESQRQHTSCGVDGSATPDFHPLSISLSQPPVKVNFDIKKCPGDKPRGTIWWSRGWQERVVDATFGLELPPPSSMEETIDRK